MISSTAAKVVAGVAILLTVILAVVGYQVSRQYAETSQRATEQARPVAPAPEEDRVPKILAVVATKPLAAYQPIAKDDVVLAEVSVAPRAYFTSLEEVVGKQPLVDVDQGAPVTQRYFAEGNVLAKAVPPGFQAVSVEVTDVIGVGGFVRPGDIVDVLLYLRGGNDVEATQARVLMEKIRVLAYHELLVDRPEGLREGETSQQGNRRQRTAVLAVPEKDTTRLMLGASMGELRLALYGAEKEGGAAAVAGTAPAPLPEGASPLLPVSADAKVAEAAKKTPDKAYTAKQLAQVEPPPAQKQKQVVRERVYVYRATQVETVTP